uniref:Candidate secreted effector n=1 Tax=Meloidogyne incognita TaxID=6306 RepID=A0A914MW20_MELIC
MKSNIIASNSYQFQNDVNIPSIICCIFLCKYRHFKYHFLSDRVISRFQISKHFSNNIFSIRPITHCINFTMRKESSQLITSSNQKVWFAVVMNN